MKNVSAGQWHTCAALHDGTAKCWGENSYGALGDGTTNNQQLPTLVAGLPGAGDPVMEMGAGHKFSCARLTSGAVKCWGNGDGGRLGNNSTANSTSPVTVTGLTAEAISLGGRHACAIAGADDHVECWGDNESGAVGNGTTTDQLTPQTVLAQATGTPLTGVIAVAGGDSHTCAIKGGAPNTLYCWGKNAKGQLGDGTTTDRNKAVVVPDAADAQAVGAGELHTCAMVAGDEGYVVKCWGDNGDGGANPAGKLGDGSNNAHLTPMPTAGLRCDDCPTDPAKVEPGECGCGFPEPGPDGLCPDDIACPLDSTVSCDPGTDTCWCFSSHHNLSACMIEFELVAGDFIHMPRPAGPPDPPSGCADLCPDGPTTCDGRGFCSCQTDVPEDGNVCTEEVPVVGAPAFVRRAARQGTACPAESWCTGTGQCHPAGVCQCIVPDENDTNPCTREQCFDGRCVEFLPTDFFVCRGDNFCNGVCFDGACSCNSPPVPPGKPLRFGTFNIKFLPDTRGPGLDAFLIGASSLAPPLEGAAYLVFPDEIDATNLGHAFADCPTDFWGNTDDECLVGKIERKVRESDYDLFALNEVFNEDGRRALVDKLRSEFPYYISKLDDDTWSPGFLPNSIQDSGLMLFSRWAFADASADDLLCPHVVNPEPLHTGRTVVDPITVSQQSSEPAVGLELTRFRGRIFLWEGRVHDGEFEVSGAVPQTHGRSGARRACA